MSVCCRHRDVISLNEIVVFEGLKSVFTPNSRRFSLYAILHSNWTFTWKCHEVIFFPCVLVTDRISNIANRISLGGDLAKEKISRIILEGKIKGAF